jgi:Zn-dependent peptidase ImmA (M78 family)
MNIAAIAANQVLDQIPVLVPEDLLLLNQIAFRLGARVVEEDLGGSEASIIIVPGNKAIITISTKVLSTERKRFSIAHELGHFQIHRNRIGFNLCSSSNIETFMGKPVDIEQEANQFASNFLLPERFVARIFSKSEPSMDLIGEVASSYEVSLTATALRFTEFTEEPIAVVLSRGGRIVFFKGAKAFTESDVFVNVGEAVGGNTMAGKLRNDQISGEGWRKVLASDWLRKGEYRRDARIQEWSVYMPRYDNILTLLWINEEIYDDEGFWGQ